MNGEFKFQWGGASIAIGDGPIAILKNFHPIGDVFKP